MPNSNANSSILSGVGMQNGNADKPGTPLTPKEQQQSQAMNQQIQNFEQTLQQRSHSELKQMAEQLETVEREMLVKKIDQELQTIKETAVQPGDAGAAAAASASAGAASAVIQDPVSLP